VRAGLAVIGARARQIGCDWRMRGTSLSKYLKLGGHEVPLEEFCVCMNAKGIVGGARI